VSSTRFFGALQFKRSVQSEDALRMTVHTCNKTFREVYVEL